MRPYLLCLAACCISFYLSAQNIPLINSGKVIQDANVAYDSGNYSGAIESLKTIHEADTNYVFMLSELAEAYQANQEYDKALETVENGLSKPSYYRPVFLKVQAQAFDKKGEKEKAITLFNSAISEYPTSTTFWYTLGVTHFSNKQYDKAVDCFFKVLGINPFHAGSHLYLGKVAIIEGRKVHAMFSLGIYMGVNSSDNTTLQLLDNFLDNEVTDEGTIPPIGTNAAEKLDRIIKARIAMEKDFKSVIPINVAVVKQYELLLDQIGTISASTDDRWVKFYLPTYLSIKQSQLVEPLVYHILTSTTIEQAKKWKSKNEKEMKTFYSLVNQELTKHRQMQVLPAYGFTQPTTAWFSGSNVFEAIGIQAGEVRQGPWIYFHPNQHKKAEGAFDKSGNKIGIWKYYHSDGTLKSEENYETGKATVYFADKTPKEQFLLKDDKIDGEVSLFYACGPVREKLGYKSGLRSGKGESYYTTGKLKSTYNHENDLLQGEYVEYYDNGVVESKSNYDKGNLHGVYKTYHSNGKLLSEGEYSNGETIGKWTYYHDNGKISRSGSYSAKGAPQAEWTYFNAKGEVTERRNFNADGKRHGENTFYDEGKVHYAFQYKNGLMTKCTYYDKTGKATASFGSSNGDFAVRHFYNTGQLSAVGNYKKGLPEGPWKYYDRFGNVSSEYSYKDGLTHGLYYDYYPTGEKKTICTYVDDDLHGYYIQYHRNGKTLQEGWYQNGNREQRWLTYYKDGTLASDYYFLRGQEKGIGKEFGVDGRLNTKYEQVDNRIVDIIQYGPDGKQRSTKKPIKLGFSYSTSFSNKKIRVKNDIVCGMFANEFLAQNPDGKPYMRYSLVNGKRQGTYEYFDSDGAKDIIAYYDQGERTGLWRRYFDNGKLFYEGKYKNDKQDSTWNYYFSNGNMSSTSNFVEGERQGASRYYTPDGVLVLEKLFVDDDVVAYRAVEPGKTNEWIPFTGTAKIQVRNSAGAIIVEQEYSKGQRHGTFKLCFSNGNIYEVEQYDGGDRINEYTIYHSNGKVSERGSYRNDEPHGKIEYFNEDGSIRKYETYHNGMLHGKEVRYSAGKPVREVTFWNGYME